MPTNNLQKLIKQKVPFSNEYQKAEVGVLFINNQMCSAFQDIIKEYGITHQQYNVLRILRGQYPKSIKINMIRERMLDKMSDASRIVDRLVNLGYVVKMPDEVDKRTTNVFINEKALELLSKLDLIINNRNTILNNLSESEIVKFNELVNKILSK